MTSRKMRSRAAAALVLISAVTVLVACGSARRSEPIAGPMNISDASVLRGRAVFDAHCFSCHTGGAGGMGPALNDKPLPKTLVRFQVRHGLGTMPAFSEKEISERELDDLVNYVVALRRHGS
jgi:mono/diheme cytochrome c family protein